MSTVKLRDVTALFSVLQKTNKHQNLMGLRLPITRVTRSKWCLQFKPKMFKLVCSSVSRPLRSCGLIMAELAWMGWPKNWRVLQGVTNSWTKTKNPECSVKGAPVTKLGWSIKWGKHFYPLSGPSSSQLRSPVRAGD